MWTADLEKTKKRYNELLKLYNEEGLNADNFFCNKYNDCHNSLCDKNVVKQFSGGTAALMPFYDIYLNKKPIRVLIVGKENGYMKNKPFKTSSNFDENILNVLNCIEWKNKNNHIKGTLMTLQRIYGVESEYIYASYTLTNLLRCAFQNTEKHENLSDVNDTSKMRDNCFEYLIKEIKILEPTLIILQGEWSIKGKQNIVSKLYEHFKESENRLMSNSNDKYGLYQFNNFMLITSHHPAILGNWIKNLAPDSLWPAIDYLKEIGYIPMVNSETSTEEYLKLVKEPVDNILKKTISNDSLRK